MDSTVTIVTHLKIDFLEILFRIKKFILRDRKNTELNRTVKVSFTNILHFVPMDIKKVIGKNVRGFRKKLGWSQEKMGTLGDLSPEYISSVENGHENPKAETIVKLAKVLKITPGQLFEANSFTE
jgi:DNA-binding XRE family transcriptional regulator